MRHHARLKPRPSRSLGTSARALACALAGLLVGCAEGALNSLDASGADAPPRADTANVEAGAEASGISEGGLDGEAPDGATGTDGAASDTSAPDAVALDGASGDAGCTLSGHVYIVAPGGADTADGSLARPLATIGRALALAQPGDTVAVRAGVYHELVTVPRSGTASAPLTLRGYCGERPVLDGTGLGNGQSLPALLSLTGRAFVTVQGFELRNLRGAGGNFPAAVWVRGASSDLTLRDLRVHDVTAEAGGAANGAHGIAVYGTSSTPTERVTIEDCELYNLVLGPSESLVLNGNVRSFVVRRNTVHDSNNIAFDFIGFEADVCTSCVNTDVVDAANVNRARDGQVYENLAYNVTSARNPAYAGELSAGCFYVDGGARIVLERNRAHHCDLGVELASEHPGLSTQQITVRDNLLWAHTVTGISTGGYDSGTGPGGGSARACVVSHNTIANSSTAGWAHTSLLLQNRNVGNTYINNIVIATTGQRAIDVGGTLNTGNSFDYNLTFNGAVAGITQGTHSLAADPRFVAAGDYHLQAGSPALDRAAALVDARDGALDLDGRPRVAGAAPDLGCYER